MSGHWIDIRGKVLLADLADTDPDVEQKQEPHASMLFTSPPGKVGETSEVMNEILLVVFAYSDADGATKVGGTIDLQPLEKSPDPVRDGSFFYVGRAPVASLPIGRATPISARYLHGLSGRLSNAGGAAAAANHFRLFYRSNR